MSRPLGGFIGYDAEPATTAAPGIWTLREAGFYQRKAQWPLPFAPDVITGLQLWLDASDASTLYDATTGGSLVAADGGVARWEDKSGNDYHMTQATAGSRPARKTAIQGGLDVLLFDGVNDVLSIPTSDLSVNGQAAITIFAVGRSLSTFSFLINNYNVATSGPGVLLALGSAGHTYGVSLEGRPTQSTGSYFFASRSFSGTDSFAAVTGKYDGETLTPYLNGAQGTQDTGPSGNLAQTTNWSMGSNSFNGGTVFYNMNIAEIIIYDSALSDNDREAVENYLLAKWGIT